MGVFSFNYCLYLFYLYLCKKNKIMEEETLDKIGDKLFKVGVERGKFELTVAIREKVKEILETKESPVEQYSTLITYLINL